MRGLKEKWKNMFNQTEKFEMPVIEVITIKAEDVIATSGGDGVTTMHGPIVLPNDIL